MNVAQGNEKYDKLRSTPQGAQGSFFQLKKKKREKSALRLGELFVLPGTE